MDTLTHAALGALVAQAAAPARSRLDTRERLLLAGVVAALPDIDFVGFAFDPLVFLAHWHQGMTHSFLLLPLWAFAAAWVFARMCRRNGVFIEAYYVCVLALTSHIVSDLITAYGTQLLAPWSSWRPSLDLVYLIDPIFTAIVVLALILVAWLRTPVIRRRVAILGLVALLGYVYGLNSLKHQAEQLALNHALAQGIDADRIAALPQPFSPFNWALIVREQDLYHRSHVNLANHPPLIPDVTGLRWLHGIAASYQPPETLNWETRHQYGADHEQHVLAAALWQRHEFAPYRSFARYPSVSRVDESDDGLCVWFTDLRYDLPRTPDTFRYGFCRDDPVSEWRLYRLRYFSKDARQPL
jgi:inner membrane protein